MYSWKFEFNTMNDTICVYTTHGGRAWAGTVDTWHPSLLTSECPGGRCV